MMLLFLCPWREGNGQKFGHVDGMKFMRIFLPPEDFSSGNNSIVSRSTLTAFKVIILFNLFTGSRFVLPVDQFG